MSEQLKAFESNRIYWAVEQVERVAGDLNDLHLDDNLFYIKSEVDKLIAEKDKEFANLKEDLFNTDRAREKWLQLARKQAIDLRHQKYKRCLSMAEMCMFKSRISYFEKKSNKSRRMSKWRQRWLELAEKFKKVK